MWTSRCKPTEHSDGEREPERVRITNRTFRPGRLWHRVVNVMDGRCINAWHHCAATVDLHWTREEAIAAIALGVLAWQRGRHYG